jgi:hypothetical protein
MASPEIVDTPAEAAELDLAPLIVRRPLEAFLDAEGRARRCRRPRTTCCARRAC